MTYQRSNSQYRLSSYGLSDIGLVRKNNEDVWCSLSIPPFYVLADGMGGHKAGEVAARETINFLCNSIEEMFSNPSRNWELEDILSFLRLFIENTNSWVYHLGKKNQKFDGMGTTLCSLLFHENFLVHAHVGDSRVYQYRKGHLEQLTEDHSLKNQMTLKALKNGTSLPKVGKNILTRSIGTMPIVIPEIEVVQVETDDIYFMCSDGLSDLLSDREIALYLRQFSTPEETTKGLISAAKMKGGNDNITIVMVQVDEKVKEKNLLR